MILIANGKEVTLKATMKRIVAITKSLKINNLKDAFFEAMREVDFAFLAELILKLSYNEEGKNPFNSDLNQVYDFIEAWVEESDNDYETLYKKVAEELNVKSFFGKKMSMEQLEEMFKNPLAGLDINKMIQDSAQKVLTGVATEEFQGHIG